MTAAVKVVRVGLRCGILGGATARVLTERASTLADRAGVRIELTKVAVRDLSKTRLVRLPEEVWTADAWSVVKDPDIDVVVESWRLRYRSQASGKRASAKRRHSR